MKLKTNISIVLYKTKLEEVVPQLNDFLSNPQVNRIFLIDNSPNKQQLPISVIKPQRVRYFFTGKNLGYGVAHNVALSESIKRDVAYHLVINPDVKCKSSDISTLMDLMEERKEIGLVMPKVIDREGNMQYLAKLLPTPTDLIIRRFTPKNWFAHRKQRFELQSADFSKEIDAPYLSGCFMFLRVEAVKKVGMFDERYFLYPEDIDLTRRIHRFYKTIYYPLISVNHLHQRASYKSMKLLVIHIWNMIKYFNKWGWIFDSERTIANRRILNDLKNQK